VFDYPPESLRDRADDTELSSGQWVLDHIEATNRYYENRFWSEKYPELTAYFDHMETKTDLDELMVDVYDNIVVNINAPRSGRSLWLPGDWAQADIGSDYPALNNAPVDEKYGRIENNLFFDADPGFADFDGKDFQLSKKTAKGLGVDWIDMSRIGVPNAPPLTRLSDAYAGTDPLKGVKYDAHFMMGFPESDPEEHETGYFKQVSLWREIADGQWEWVNESALDTERAAGIFVRPGANYAVYFHGDSQHPPQFVGVVRDFDDDDGSIEAIGAQVNIPAEPFTPPPSGITKFKVNSSGWVNFELSE
jgi:hypothetical protein